MYIAYITQYISQGRLRDKYYSIHRGIKGIKQYR